MIPFFEPLDEKYRWCVYCGADCWPEPENQQHKGDCPSVTGLWPVSQEDVERGASCGKECGHVFQLGEYYMHTEVEENGPDKVVTVACIACAFGEHMEQGASGE